MKGLKTVLLLLAMAVGAVGFSACDANVEEADPEAATEQSIPLAVSDFATGTLQLYQWDLASGQLAATDKILANDAGSSGELYWDGNNYLVASVAITPGPGISVRQKQSLAPCFGEYIFADYQFDYAAFPLTRGEFTIAGEQQSYSFDLSACELPFANIEDYSVCSFSITDSKAYFLLATLLSSVAPRQLAVVEVNLADKAYQVHQVGGETVAFVGAKPPLCGLSFATETAFVLSDGVQAVYQIDFTDYRAEKVFDLAELAGEDQPRGTIWAVGYSDDYLLVKAKTNSELPDSVYYAVADGAVAGILETELQCFLPNL